MKLTFKELQDCRKFGGNEESEEEQITIDKVALSKLITEDVRKKQVQSYLRWAIVNLAVNAYIGVLLIKLMGH